MPNLTFALHEKKCRELFTGVERHREEETSTRRISQTAWEAACGGRTAGHTRQEQQPWRYDDGCDLET